MLLMVALACLSLARPDLLAVKHPVPPELPTRAQTAAAPHNKPRLVGQAVFAKQEVVALGPSTPDAFAVYTRDNTRPMKDPLVAPYLPPPRLQVSAHRLTDAGFLWGRTLNADRVDAQAADAHRLYATLQLPLASYDPHTMKPGDFHHELTALDWATGREVWRVPGTFLANVLALNGLVVYEHDRADSACVLTALDAETGQPRWRQKPSEIEGLFAANGLIYAYNESRDYYGPTHDPQGEYLNAYNPSTGKSVQRIRFYDDFRPLSRLSALAWFPQAQRLVGAYELASPGTQQVEIRAFDGGGKPAWNRPHVGAFKAVGDVLVCENSLVMGSEHDYDMSKGLIALDAATGRELWQRKDLNAYNLNGYDLNVCGSQVVVRNGGFLIALDARTGKTTWKLALSAAPSNVSDHPLTPQTKTGTRKGAKTTSAGAKKGTIKTPEPTYAVRVYERCIAIATSGRAGQAATVRVYAVPE